MNDALFFLRDAVWLLEARASVDEVDDYRAFIRTLVARLTGGRDVRRQVALDCIETALCGRCAAA